MHSTEFYSYKASIIKFSQYSRKHFGELADHGGRTLMPSISIYAYRLATRHFHDFPKFLYFLHGSGSTWETNSKSKLIFMLSDLKLVRINVSIFFSFFFWVFALLRGLVGKRGVGRIEWEKNKSLLKFSVLELVRIDMLLNFHYFFLVLTKI